MYAANSVARITPSRNSTHRSPEMDFTGHRSFGPHMDNRMQTVQRALGVRNYPQMRASVAELDENHEMDGNILLHSMEKEAYTAVLRAFSAQSDAISWSKEGIITELRRELNVSDLEHGQLLVEINADEFVRKLRGWKKNASLSQEMLCSRMDTPSSVVQSISQSNKILKQSCNDVSTFRRYVSPNQQTSATNLSSFPVCYNGQRVEESPSRSTRNTMHPAETIAPNLARPSPSKHAAGKHNYRVADNVNVQKRSVIEIRSTSNLLHQVESMIFGTKSPDSVQVENAKAILMEQETAILNALAKLTDLTNNRGDDYGPPSEEELQGIRRR